MFLYEEIKNVYYYIFYYYCCFVFFCFLVFCFFKTKISFKITQKTGNTSLSPFSILTN